MNKIITTDESDIELDPESLTDNVDINNVIFKNKNKMLEAIRDLDNLLDANINEKNSMPAEDIEPEVTKNSECYIRVKSKNTNHEFRMNFKLVGLNQGIIERNCAEFEMEASEKKLISFFAFYQNTISTKKKNKKISKNNVNQLKVLFSKRRGNINRRKRKMHYKNDVFVTTLVIKANGKKITLIDNCEQLWRISEMRYTVENNRSTCKVSLTRTH